MPDLHKDARCGPDPDTGHRDQEPGKRQGIEGFGDLSRDLFALRAQDVELAGAGESTLSETQPCRVMVTVCSASATQISPARRSPIRGTFFFNVFGDLR